jgi:hypothetical protein
VKRVPAREWLDDPSLPSETMAENLADIAKVDRMWGGARALSRWLAGRGLPHTGRRLRILDLGAGSAAVTRRLRSALAESGFEADVFALDLQWRHLRAGRRRNGGPPLPAVAGMAADALRLPLADASVDWAVSTLFLHHFSPEQLRTLVAEARRVARRGFAFLDLRRHPLPLAFLRLAGPLLFASPVTVHDGAASIRQAYTPAELDRLLFETRTAAEVRRLFPFRLLATWDRGAA